MILADDDVEAEDEEKRRRPAPTRMRHRSSSSRLAAADNILVAAGESSTAILSSRRSSAPEIDQDSTAEDEVEPLVAGSAYTRSLERTRLGQNNNSGRSSDSEAAPVPRAATAPHRRRDLERAVAQVQESLGAGRLGLGRHEAAERTETKAVVHRAEANKAAEAGYPQEGPQRQAPGVQQKRYSGAHVVI
jgi:hypothetical protein